MALILCPECKGEVSDQAASCPHCGYPLPEPPVAFTPPLDVTLRQLLTHGNKIAAIKLYRDYHPEASLSVCKEYVDQLEAAMSPTLRSPGNRATGGTCLLLFCLLLVLMPFVMLWSLSHRSPAATHPPSLPAAHR